MARDAQYALKTKIEEEGRFDRAYYFFGDEDYRKEALIRLIIGKAVDPATRDFNLDQYRSAGLTGASLGSLLATPPVLASRRVIVIRDVGSLKKDARGVLQRYLAKPSDDIILLLASPAGEKPDAGLASLTTSVEFATPNQPNIVRWIMEHAAEVHDARFSEGAAELLYATVGGDLAALAAEIDKSVSYAGRDVDTPAVEAIVGIRHGETLGNLLDAVARRRAAEALRLIPIVLTQPKNGLVPVLGALGTQLMAIGTGVAAKEAGASEGAVRARLWDLLKSSAPNTGGPWGEAVERWTRAIPLWTDAAIQSGLRVVLATDRAAKDSRVASDEQLLSNVVLELCGDARRVAA